MLLALLSIGVLAAGYAVYVVVNAQLTDRPTNADLAVDANRGPGDVSAGPEATPTTTVSVGPSVSAGPSASTGAASTRPATVPAQPTVGPPAGSSLPAGAWPHPGNTGVPAGWQPKSTQTTDLKVSTAGAVIEDIRLVNADIVVTARDVTIRRVEIQGGGIFNNGTGSNCSGMLLENVSIVKAPGQVTSFSDGFVIGPGGYTARSVKVDGLAEGLRISDKDRCGPVLIERSFIRVRAPDACNGDWHGDGIQGYYGAALTVRNSTVDMAGTSKSCDGTSPFFYPDQGNTRADVDGLLVKGGLYLGFRLQTPGSVKNLMIVKGTGVEALCTKLSTWSAAEVNADANYQPTVLRSLPCV